jgi:hypothetical protein
LKIGNTAVTVYKQEETNRHGQRWTPINIKFKYDKQDQQGKAAFNERKPHTTQQQEPVKHESLNVTRDISVC